MDHGIQLTSSRVVWLTKKFVIFKAVLLASSRSKIFATPPAVTGTWYSNMLRCWSCGNQRGKKIIPQCQIILSRLDITWQRAKKHTEIHSSGNDQFSSVAQSCPTLCNPMDCSMPGLPFTNSRSSLRLTSIKSVMPSSHLILCGPLLLLPSVFPSSRVLSNESALRIRWPTYWSFSFSISPSNKYSGLISFRMDYLDLLAVQGTPKSLLWQHSQKH